ncbi:hypothetical protein AB6A40_004724 [Gnathostoma spinigerum]|uniref:SWIRM domain-containing protein n=1 Tax=Gnathostoma spinigerum TaxID=75299 RepID=A0ABD6EP14_9BILA
MSSRSSSSPSRLQTKIRCATVTKNCSQVHLSDLLTGYDSMDILQWEDDDQALKNAAAQSRLPYDKVTTQEFACFPELHDSEATINLFLYIRNKILQLWHLESHIELTVEDVYEQLAPPYNSDSQFVRRIFAFLKRYGFINFGRFTRVKAPTERVKKRVIVIGAGAAGLAAARQLQYFGIEVLVLEARQRLGGRIFTYRKPPNIIVDQGAMIVMGSLGNPMITLAKQITTSFSIVEGNDCPIYDPCGRMIERRKDRLIERAFHRIEETALYISHTKNITKVSGHNLSLAEAYDVILNCRQLEHRQQKRREDFLEKFKGVLQDIKNLQDSMVMIKKTLKALHAKLEELQAEDRKGKSNDEKEKALRTIKIRCIMKDIRDSVKTYEEVDERRKEFEAALLELRKNEPSDVFMHDCDLHIMDFHFANLEYSMGTTLNNCSLKYYNQDDENELQGSHLSVKEGYGSLIEPLAENLPVHLGCIVESIKSTENGVEVRYSMKGVTDTVFADVCLCTVPLGVLKRSVAGESDAPQFDPPLPEEKQEAIKTLGFGNLNKVILVFDKVFWDSHHQLFGHVCDGNNSTRGEFYLFYAVHECPILIGMLAGAAADLSERLPSEMLVRQAMHILTNIFGSACPQEPVQSIVTKWKSDPYARGCYSYISPNGSGELYDLLAMPVKSASGKFRIFFAGEHTNRQFPSSVHGAFLSGLREAGRIADQLIGCPYSPFVPEIITLDDE